MERLTRRDIVNGVEIVRINKGAPPFVVNEKLADYEDAEEQGLLLRLPCKVGTLVYQIHTMKKSDRKFIVEVEADTFFLALCVIEKRFGKTVFLTRKEAEQALNQMGEQKYDSKRIL